MYPGGINFWAELGVDKARGKWGQRKATKRLDRRVAPTALKMAASWERARRGHWSIIFIAGSAVIRSALEKNEITLSAMWGKDQPMGRNWRKQDHREAGTVLGERGWSSGLRYWWGQRLPDEKVCRFLGFTKNLGELDVEEENSWLFN